MRTNTRTLTPLKALQFFQILRFSSTLLIGILLAKVFGFTTGEIAIYEVLLFLGNFLSFFWISAGQKGLLIAFPDAIEQQGKLLFNVFFVLLTFGLIAAIFLYWGQGWLIRQLTQYDHLAYIHFVCFYLFFNAPAQLTEYIYLLKKAPHSIIRYGIVIHFLLIVAIVSPIVMGLGLEGIFKGLVLWSLLKFLWLLKVLIQYANFSLDWVLQKKFLLLIFPLCLHLLIGGGMEYVDGFIVTHYFAEEKMFAIFRYGARELPLVSILITSLASSLIPIAVENEEVALESIKVEVQKLCQWLYPIIFALMLLSPYLFPLVYNEDFKLSAKVFNIYLLVVGSRILLPQVLIHSRKHNYILVWSAVMELIVNLSLSLYFVSDYGLEGIAFATVIAYLLNKIFLIAYINHYFNISLSKYLNIKYYLLYNALLLLIFLTVASINGNS